MSNDVRVRITGDATGVKKATREANQSLAGLADGAAKLAAPLQAVFAGVSAGAFAGKLIAVQREFDVLNASLVTVTGSGASRSPSAWAVIGGPVRPGLDNRTVRDRNVCTSGSRTWVPL